MPDITPCLWFEHEAEEAAHHYVSLFKNARLTGLSRYGEGAPLPAGTAMIVSFELDGRPFMALNGRPPAFALSPAISLVAYGDTQAELDALWDGLSAGGAAMECGWLTDRYGVAWQIVPAALGAWVGDGSSPAAQRVMQALWTMVKLDIATLERAYRGE